MKQRRLTGNPQPDGRRATGRLIELELGQINNVRPVNPHKLVWVQTGFQLDQAVVNNVLPGLGKTPEIHSPISSPPLLLFTC
ncbi:hypothetical protein LX87_03939 [Larkinella arboricola]|uniref:Uncharacterized protein n=1 Tax=Larkinella arboricola TaxID=643671 RepID=A0A327WX27_LARAB|nr:hypothetical protein LX87_03939 [Larkinella arboricola]